MRRNLFVLIIVLLIIPTLLGCVRRRMTVTSNPPGANVYLDGQEIGRTPFSTNFDHYGKREFRVVKQGYETQTELKKVSAPWFQWPGIDFFSEIVLPGKLTDHKYYEFELQPASPVSGAEIVSRAEDFRSTAHGDGVLRVGHSPTVVPPSSVGSIVPPATIAPPISQPVTMTPTEEPPQVIVPRLTPGFAPIVPPNPSVFTPPMP